ncbi:MAG TPA: glycosyltransferase, partial [Rhodothermales bacterium]|nr:glycosyltransferase [Rhodothermales bacterium]
VHMHGLDFLRCLPPQGVPVLVTLHLPPDWYPSETFDVTRPDTYLHCVSGSQAAACPAGARLLPEIENGVDVEGLRVRHARRGFVMAMGRICWEKGFHLALDAAHRADVPMLLAGYVAPYYWHRHTFEHAVKPWLDARRRFIGQVGFDRKRRLLTAARCLLVPSTCAETSSLVAMEALACGTPVVAFPSGALPDIVEHGKTGFIVRDVDEMAGAIHAAAELDPEACRAAARARFSLARMIGQYFDVYRKLAAGEAVKAETAESIEPVRRRRHVA